MWKIVVLTIEVASWFSYKLFYFDLEFSDVYVKFKGEYFFDTSKYQQDKASDNSESNSLSFFCNYSSYSYLNA